MSRAATLGWGVFVTGAIYAACLWFFYMTLSPSSFPTVLAAILATPAIIAGGVAFRRNPDGHWWIIPMITVLLTAALMLAGIVIILSGSHEL